METDAGKTLRDLRDRVRALRVEHDQAATRFRSNQAVGDVLVGLGSLWVEDTFDFPSSEARRAAGNLRARWKESPEYRELESRYKGLEDGVREAFLRLRRHPPSLRKAREATLLPTKLVRLEAIVDEAIDRLERPPSRRAIIRTPSRPPPPKTKERMTILDIVGLVGSLASIVSLILYVLTPPFSLLVASILGLVSLLLAIGVVVSLWHRKKRGGK